MGLLDSVIKQTLSVYKLTPDSLGNFTIVEEKRPNGTLFKRSTVSNKVNGKYTTRTEQRFGIDGVTVLDTKVYTIAYNSSGVAISEVLV